MIVNNDSADHDATDNDSVTSNEALCELLGIQSLDDVKIRCNEEDINDDEQKNRQHDDDCILPNHCQSVDDLMHVSDAYIKNCIEQHHTNRDYEETNVCIFPNELSIPSAIMRRLTDEVVWGVTNGTNSYGVDRTYETIKYCKKKTKSTASTGKDGDNDIDGTIYERSTITRLENLNHHVGWSQLCNNYIQRCISNIMGEEMVLYKIKLNIKPPGGSGFAPHVDTPSLTVPFPNGTGPQNFVTVMIAIDDMNEMNGCLRVVRGKTNVETYCCPIIPPNINGNPDSNGRAGAIPMEYAETKIQFDPICCSAGTICAFGGWIPHRSNPNMSQISPRRAVFITYNPINEGDYYDLYYQKMKQLRYEYEMKLTNIHIAVASKTNDEHVDPTMATKYNVDKDIATEVAALATIP